MENLVILTPSGEVGFGEGGDGGFVGLNFPKSG